jgi:glucosamine-6-phosphate deaminase
MHIVKAKDYSDMSRKAANIISAQVIMKPDCVLGLATGSTPLGIYAQLIDWYKKDDLDFSRVSSVNLDEYKGLEPDNPQSYHYFMQENFFKFINISATNAHIPDGMELDIQKACSAHNQIIRRLGGVDLQLLGLGLNGHIGFNEPGASFEKETHCVNLAESTIRANARFFDSPTDVPTQAYTMGIKSIMMAKKILIAVSGIDKAEIVVKSFQGPVTPQVPASILQMHPDVTIVGDVAALSLLYFSKDQI